MPGGSTSPSWTITRSSGTASRAGSRCPTAASGWSPPRRRWTPSSPGRGAHVVLLDLDLGDGTTVAQNVAAILTAGPAVLVLSASDRPAAVRDAIRAGARGYVLKQEE